MCEIDYNQGDVAPEGEDPEIDEEEVKRQEEEEAKRKLKPDHFKAHLLSRAGEGTDDPNYNLVRYI